MDNCSTASIILLWFSVTKPYVSSLHTAFLTVAPLTCVFIGFRCRHRIMPRINEARDTKKRYGLNLQESFDYNQREGVSHILLAYHS